METTISVNLGQVAHDLGLPPDKVVRTVELLDEGNTAPFITRYRKDQTGGLDEEQIRSIKEKVGKLRMLAERKRTILKSIESQGKLTPELAEQIQSAGSTKRLEDVYLPYKPKKQTLAGIARQRDLAPLAGELLEANPAAADLEARAADFVSPDKHLHSVAEVLLGVGHLLAERFSEQAELRGRLRKIMRRSGMLTSVRAAGPAKSEGGKTPAGLDQPPVEQAPAKPAEVPSPPQDAPVADSPPSPEPKADEPSVTLDDGKAQTGEAEETPAAGPPPAAPAGAPQAAGLARQSKKQKRERLENAFRDYFDFRAPVSQVAPHHVLAMNRGERAKVLRVKIEADLEAMAGEAEMLVAPPDHPHAEFLKACARDALTRLVAPGLEREMRRELTERAEEHAVQVFVRDLRRLLLQAPVRGRRLLAIDPGLHSGCKVSALDEFGGVLDHGVIHAAGNEERRRETRAKIAELTRKHGLSVAVIGNGTGARQVERLVAETISEELKDCDVAYVLVNEAGASVYSTSPLGREELPQYDASLRSAISIGRRLLDPLSELVKINPANIGVGMYQHDVKAKHLREPLEAVVESCVNYVGVDLNTASPALLRYVSGLNQLTARRIYEYRLEHGPFSNRQQLNDVPGFGEAAFVQAAGFLRIVAGDSPLDATWIHPESYDIARRVLEKLGVGIEEVARAAGSAASREKPKSADGSHADAERPATQPLPSAAVPPPGAGTSLPLVERLAKLDIDELSREFQVGPLLLKDILAALSRPGRDPRDDLPPPVFRRGVLKLEDLQPGMALSGVVLNVVDFGVFVAIGLSDTGLIHISRLADRYVRDPHDVVGVGDVIAVWVVDVDKQRRRVSLTAVKPSSEKPLPPRAGKPESVRRKSPQRRDEQQGAVRSQQRRDRSGAREGRQRPQPKPRQRPPKAPKPMPPITKEMEEGTEPMRSFSDLLQFYEKKKGSDEESRQS